MRFIKHSAHHVLIHLSLFSGFAVLIPITTQAFEKSMKPWVVSPSIFTAGTMLILISALMLYRVKNSLSGVLQSLGYTIFIPGAISLLSGVMELNDLLEGSSITGLSVIKPVAEYYIHHSVPTVLSVAAVYLFIGGVLYWLGSKLDNAKRKFSWN
ncbi:hypothetical protein D6825_03475 [Candidatus Woesearchaeota archaeon]|nr:MAG: hypothetical protein D6825_03475 [Candidatus Woesearchaeota archaeon]